MKDTLEKVLKLYAYIEAIDNITERLDGYVTYPLKTLVTNALSLCSDVEDDVREKE